MGKIRKAINTKKPKSPAKYAKPRGKGIRKATNRKK
tara:strand:+ start:634 stop:741 length:108 start_codon:yes stop_codon:yes gene_type:complete